MSNVRGLKEIWAKKNPTWLVELIFCSVAVGGRNQERMLLVPAYC